MSALAPEALDRVAIAGKQRCKLDGLKPSSF
jgi:hypothetical protein